MTTITLPAKRKRAQVSYTEPEDDELDLLYAPTKSVNKEKDADLPEGDSIYGSCKNTRSTFAGKKRAKVTKAKPKKSEKPFPFLSLPAELRDCIYELALVEPGELTLVSKTKAYRRIVARGAISRERQSRYGYRYGSPGEEMPTQHNQLTPNLLAVNKQIHAEAVGYLYKQPVVLEDTVALHTFIAGIGPKNRLQLDDIVVKGWGTGRGTHKASNAASMTLLSTCTNLRKFTLNCHISWRRRDPRATARQLYRDGHHFLEGFGAANGRKDAALDVLVLSEWTSRENSMPEEREDKAEESKYEFQREMRKLLKC